MIISRRNAAIIRQLAGSIEEAKRYEVQYESCDDNMIGSRINNRNIKLNLYYEDVFHSVGCVDLYEKTLPFDNDDSYEMDWSCPGYQIKTFNSNV